MKEDELPAGWVRKKIAELLLPNSNGKPFQQGYSPKCHPRPADEESWGVLKTTAIQTNDFWPDENKELPEHIVVKPHLEVKVGDIVMTCAGPRSRCGVPCLVRKTRSKLLLSGKMYRFRADPNLMDSRYLMHFLATIAAQNAIDRMKTGINDSGLNLTHDRFAKLVVPAAPVADQQRIVEKIETLFAELDKGEEALREVQKLLDRYRQSVLKAAVSGELTSDWRAASSPAQETGEELLARILEERRETWQGRGKYDEPTKPNTQRLPELPEGWAWASLPMLGEFGRGKSKHRPRNDPKLYEGGTYPFLQTGRVRNSSGRISEYDKLYNELGLAQSKLWPVGTVCITIAANIAESGILEMDACFPDSVVGLVPHEEIEGSYIELFIRTAKADLDRYAPATAQKNINIDTLNSVAVPLPPADEQKEIADRVASLLGASAVIEKTIADESRRVTALRQSILQDAFSGRLVTQDPSDEPAEELLKRIRAARSQVSKPTRRKVTA